MARKHCWNGLHIETPKIDLRLMTFIKSSNIYLRLACRDRSIIMFLGDLCGILKEMQIIDVTFISLRCCQKRSWKRHDGVNEKYTLAIRKHFFTYIIVYFRSDFKQVVNDKTLLKLQVIQSTLETILFRNFPNPNTKAWCAPSWS